MYSFCWGVILALPLSLEECLIYVILNLELNRLYNNFAHIPCNSVIVWESITHPPQLHTTAQRIQWHVKLDAFDVIASCTCCVDKGRSSHCTLSWLRTPRSKQTYTMMHDCNCSYGGWLIPTVRADLVNPVGWYNTYNA